jgi:NTP pyrophosphatase (non-canonical NTP hydrolase)
MTIDDLTRQVFDFRERRDWAQYHHPKELASALSIEVAEIMELFRFKSADEVKEMVNEPDLREKLGNELADSLFLLLLLAHESGVDLNQAFARKLEILEKRYPEELAKGRNDKWTAYQD